MDPTSPESIKTIILGRLPSLNFRLTGHITVSPCIQTTAIPSSPSPTFLPTLFSLRPPRTPDFPDPPSAGSLDAELLEQRVLDVPPVLHVAGSLDAELLEERVLDVPPVLHIEGVVGAGHGGHVAGPPLEAGGGAGPASLARDTLLVGVQVTGGQHLLQQLALLLLTAVQQVTVLPAGHT